MLFRRSKLFRALACERLDEVLDLVVAYSRRTDLPEPAQSARELKRQGLLCLAKWKRTFGSKCPRIALGYRYLQSLPYLEFPMEAIRDEEPQQDESGRLQDPRPGYPSRQGNSLGPGDSTLDEETQSLLRTWSETIAGYSSLRTEMHNSFSLIQEMLQRAATSRDSEQSAGEEDLEESSSDNEWEDVEIVDSADEGEESHEENGKGPTTTAIPDTIVPMLAGYQRAKQQIIPELQKTIRICSRNAEHARVRNVLHQAADMNGSLVGMCAQYEATFGKASLNDCTRNVGVGSEAGENCGSRRQISDRAPISRCRAHRIRDPTMPRMHKAMCDGHQAKSNTSNPRKQPINPWKNTTGANKDTDIPKKISNDDKGEVLKRLAQIAPKLPLGPYAQVWEKDAPPVYAGSHVLDVSNHWGPVDIHQKLPEERMHDFFLVSQSLIAQPCQSTLASTSASAPLTIQKKEPLTGGLSTQARVLLRGDADTKQKRKMEREFNEDVLRSTALERALEQTSSRANRKRPRLTVHQRLEKKLLSKTASARRRND